MRVQKMKVVDIPSVIRGPVRMWKDQKIKKSQVRDDEANVFTERTERQSTTREKSVLVERTAKILQAMTTEGNVEVIPFRMKNFSAQGGCEVRRNCSCLCGRIDDGSGKSAGNA